MKNYIFICTIFILCSCNTKEHKEIILKLETKLEEEKEKTDLLIESNKDLAKEQESLKNRIERINTDYVLKENISFLTKTNSWVTVNNKKLVEYFFEKNDFKKFDAESTMKWTWMLYPGYSKYPFGGEEFFANYIMISRIDKSPQSLAQIITPEIKEVVYSIFKKNNLYKNCGAYSLVKSLLLAYDDFKNEKEPLAQIYKIASESHKNNESIKSIISSMTSKEILDALNDENYTIYTKKNYSTKESRLITIYTFWARRYNENNLEFTHSLLQEIHKNITGENLLTNSDSIIDYVN
ncbi:hypothetical protein I2486_00890 [Cellulophaga sp. E16_2]|uniref:hypothetical protein n=1 Tax=Cellulophaga sp. E16_2 TaxID=2789297 RepID=UPI001A915259|nr:hypothetical protein [Cellulophaga sp. E16_2]MBO0589951.1 hypothetical protein [Cellulophaga sp. E16_2]